MEFNKQKENLVENNTTYVKKRKFNSENWFYLILFIILNISFSSIVTTESAAKNLIFILYPFIVIYIPIILLIILNIKKRKQNLFRVYLTSTLLIIIGPFVLNVILSSLDLRDWTLIAKILLSIGAIIYIIFQILKKSIDVNDNNIKIKQNNFNNVVETNPPINNKNNPYKIIALIFYNCIIVYLILTTDFSDWGGLIMGPIVSLMIFIGNPLITWLLFRKNNNKGKIIFISFISTIILTYVASFFGNPDNINNLIENNKEDKEIKSILNDTNNNIEIYSNDEFKLLINIDKECLYKIDKTKGNGEDANVIIQRNYKLLTIDLVQKLIDENTFNEYLLFTKNINNENANVTMNIKYKTIDNKEDNQGVFRVNDKYYIFENDGREWIFDDILKENNILQEKIFSIIENIDYLPYKTEYKYDFYADETFDYLILYNEVRDKFMYYQTYKCDFENKSNSERLKEFFNFRKYSSKSFNIGEYNEYIINNGKIEKIIIYEFGGNQVWIEIFPSNFKNSLFIEVFAFTNKEKRIIKDSISSNNGAYDIPEYNQYDTNKLNEIKQEFNTILNSEFISVNDIKLSSNYNIVKSINLLISNEYITDNETDFCNSLIQAHKNIKELLNKYNYTSQTIHFEFTNNNPFAKEDSINYKKSGYIRFGGYSDSDRTWYDIYLNPTPIKIN